MSHSRPLSAACQLEQILGPRKDGAPSLCKTPKSASSARIAARARITHSTPPARCGDLVCVLTFIKCGQHSELESQQLESALRPGFGVGSRAVTTRFCLSVRDAWAKTCSGPHGNRQHAIEVGSRKTRAGCDGEVDTGWRAGGIRLVLQPSARHGSIMQVPHGMRLPPLPPPPPSPPSPPSPPPLRDQPCTMPGTNWSCTGGNFFRGTRLAAVPMDFPVRLPAHCEKGSRWRIPRIVMQTGRGDTARQHNEDASGQATALARKLAGGSLHYRWFNDSAAHAFVATNCPRALAAYDCLVPKSYKADVFRYVWRTCGHAVATRRSSQRGVTLAILLPRSVMHRSAMHRIQPQPARRPCSSTISVSPMPHF